MPYYLLPYGPLRLCRDQFAVEPEVSKTSGSVEPYLVLVTARAALFFDLEIELSNAIENQARRIS